MNKKNLIIILSQNVSNLKIKTPDMKRNEVKKKSVISNKDCEWYCFIEYYKNENHKDQE